MATASLSSRRRPRRRADIERSKRRAGWVLAAPALAHMGVFLLLPMVAMVALSFTDYNFSGAWQWIGFENYTKLFADERFRAALVNTILYSVATVPFAMGIALLIAIGLNQSIVGKGAYRVFYYVPQVTATVAVATVWLWIYNPDAGLANGVLSFFGVQPVKWLQDTGSALPSVMAVGIWQGLGAKMVIYLAALQAVSREQQEAAQLDGAKSWQVFRYVTWPALGAAHFFVLITSIIASFQVFDLVYVMTKGGPVNATRVLGFDIYQNAFQGLQLGYASAESVILFILIGAVTMLGFRLQRPGTDG
jgi:multiple sugar transport system permease protein